MEVGEDFWLRFYNGSTWSTVATYARGTSFNNNTFYVATVTLNASQYNFPTNAQFRFQCDASANDDLVYIDQVTITGISGTARGNNNNLIALGTLDRNSLNDQESIDEDFKVYPNPTKDILNVKVFGIESANFKIVNVLGQTVKSGRLTNEKINVSSLQSGMYVIEVNDGEEVMTKRFVKE
jgi:bacillolysin